MDKIKAEWRALSMRQRFCEIGMFGFYMACIYMIWQIV